MNAASEFAFVELYQDLQEISGEVGHGYWDEIADLWQEHLLDPAGRDPAIMFADLTNEFYMDRALKKHGMQQYRSLLATTLARARGMDHE